MRVPGKLRKVKPNEVVVFENEIDFNGKKYNAITQRDDKVIIFFDTEHYETNATPKFYGLPEIYDVQTVYGYGKEELDFARELMKVGITPHELKEHYHDFEWVAKLIRDDLDEQIKSSFRSYFKEKNG